MSQNKDHTTPPRAEEALANTEHLNGDVEARARFYLGAAHSHLDTAWRTLNEALDLTQATGIRQKVNVSREHIRELAQMKGSDLEVLEVTGKSEGWTDEELSALKARVEKVHDEAMKAAAEAEKEASKYIPQPNGTDVGNVARVMLNHDDEDDEQNV